MSENIRKMYRAAGLAPPKGRGIHTVKAHKCVIRYRQKGLTKDEAWKRCMGGLGKHAVKASHRRS